MVNWSNSSIRRLLVIAIFCSSYFVYPMESQDDQAKKSIKDKRSNHKNNSIVPPLWGSSGLKRIKESLTNRLSSRIVSHRDQAKSSHHKSDDGFERRRSSSLDSLRDYVGNVNFEALREEYKRKNYQNELEIIEVALDLFIEKRYLWNYHESEINTKLEKNWNLLIEKTEKGAGSKRNAPISSVLRRLKVLKELAKSKLTVFSGMEGALFNWEERINKRIEAYSLYMETTFAQLDEMRKIPQSLTLIVDLSEIMQLSSIDSILRIEENIEYPGDHVLVIDLDAFFQECLETAAKFGNQLEEFIAYLMDEGLDPVTNFSQIDSGKGAVQIISPRGRSMEPKRRFAFLWVLESKSRHFSKFSGCLPDAKVLIDADLRQTEFCGHREFYRYLKDKISGSLDVQNSITLANLKKVAIGAFKPTDQERVERDFDPTIVIKQYQLFIIHCLNIVPELGHAAAKIYASLNPTYKQGTKDDLLACYFVCACLEVYVMRKCLEDIVRPFIMNDQDDKYLSECWKTLDQNINSNIYPIRNNEEPQVVLGKRTKNGIHSASVLFDYIHKIAQKYSVQDEIEGYY